MQTGSSALIDGFFVILKQKLTWEIASIIFLLFLIRYFWKKYKNHREGFLSQKINKELKESWWILKYNNFILKLEQIYYPSWVSLFVVSFCVLFFYILAHSNFSQFPAWIEFDGNSHYQNLIAIHSGIGAIIFALVIFIAESFRDDKLDRARVLLRESFLFPLSVFEILVFFIFGWSNINVFSLIPIAIVAMLTIFSLWRLLSVLLSESKFFSKRLNLLKDKLHQDMGTAVQERIGNAILLKQLGGGVENINLDYFPFPVDDDTDSGRVLFKTNKTGIVYDINLNKLSKFSEILEKEANNNGFSFSKDKVKPISSSVGGDVEIVNRQELEKYLHKPKQYLHVKLKDQLEINQTLISIDASVVKNEKIISKLKTLIKDVFVIRSEENFSDEMRLEFKNLRDDFLSAIEENKKSKVEELIKIYLMITEEFLGYISKYGGGYTYEQAKKERGAFGGWNEIQWLKDDLYEIYHKAVQINDRRIIDDVAHLPVAIATRAIKAGDQYVYQEFINFPVWLYSLADKQKDLELREFIVGRCWRYLKETSDYYIESYLDRKAIDVETVDKYAEFVIPIFFTFQNLLKSSFDKKDKSAFEIFLDNFLKLYHRTTNPTISHSSEFIEERISYIDDEEEKVEMRKKLLLQKKKEEVAKDIANMKEQILLGLSAFIFNKYKSNVTDAVVKEMYEKIASKLPTNLEKLSKLYGSTRTFETEHFWQWDNWEMIYDEEAHIINFHKKIDEFFCVKSLLILQLLTAEQLVNTKISPSREIAFLAEDRQGDETLISILNRIESEATSWSSVLPLSAIAKIPLLKNMLISAKNEQKKKEEEELRVVEISNKKLQEFKKDVLDAFNEGVGLRKVFSMLGAYVDNTDKVFSKDIPLMGYNQMADKASFIENWYVHYGDFGKEYGHGIVRSEDQIVIDEIVQAIPNKKDIARKDVVKEIESYLNFKKFKNPIIIHTLKHYDSYEIKNLKDFTNKYQTGGAGSVFKGLHNYDGDLSVGKFNIPVFNIFAEKESLQNKLIVLDIDNFGNWVQYTPYESEKDEDSNMVLIRVLDLNKDNDRRQKILDEKPEWLNKYDDKEGYLRGHVVINVYEKFIFEIKNKNVGVVFTLPTTTS